jgi:hypothetical protein
MIKHFIALLVRNVIKHAFFTGFNILGLGIAIAFGIISYFNFTADATYDSNHQNGKSIYRVTSIRQFEGTETPFAIVPAPLREVVKENSKDVTASTRFAHSHSLFKVHDDLFHAELAYADISFFNLFSLDFMAGNASSFRKKDNVILTDEMAKRLFGTAQSLGKPLTLLVGDTKKEVTVGGIIRKPKLYSSFQSAAYLNYENYYDEFTNEVKDDWQYRTTLFIQITNPTKVGLVTNQLQANPCLA